ncbi:MAG TPA: hypothetical protein VMF69_20135, partial [Gemmataceae bacterium]|nr:hypothetical protein [Gemmataceae bacterium]
MLLNANNPVDSAAAGFLNDVAKVRSDVENVNTFLLNAAQPSPTSGLTPAAEVQQWNKVESVLVADWGQMQQAFVQYEFAVLEVYEQTIVQTFATLLADVDGNLTGHLLLRRRPLQAAVWQAEAPEREMAAAAIRAAAPIPLPTVTPIR